MKSSWFSKPLHHEFAKCLEAADPSQGLWTPFQSFLEASYCSLSQGVYVMTRGVPDRYREERYAAAVRRVKTPDKLAEAMAVMVHALEREPYDFIGAVAGELDLLNQWGGQFFTPPCVCDMMARMTFGDLPENPGHRVRIAEPACGAGAMVIAVAKLMKERGVQPWQWWVDATDLDQRMFYAAYIQFTLLGIPGIVRNGNTLSGEMRESMPTFAGALHPLREETREAQGQGEQRPRRRQLPPRKRVWPIVEEGME